MNRDNLRASPAFRQLVDRVVGLNMTRAEWQRTLTEAKIEVESR